jgi:hypothetical protein
MDVKPFSQIDNFNIFLKPSFCSFDEISKKVSEKIKSEIRQFYYYLDCDDVDVINEVIKTNLINEAFNIFSILFLKIVVTKKFLIIL